MPDDIALHPEMRILIDAKKSLPPAETLDEMRAGWAAYSAATRAPYPDGMRVEDRQVPRANGSVPVRVRATSGFAER